LAPCAPTCPAAVPRAGRLLSAPRARPRLPRPARRPAVLRRAVCRCRGCSAGCPPPRTLAAAGAALVAAASRPDPCSCAALSFRVRPARNFLVLRTPPTELSARPAFPLPFQHTFPPLLHRLPTEPAALLSPLLPSRSSHSPSFPLPDLPAAAPQSSHRTAALLPAPAFALSHRELGLRRRMRAGSHGPCAREMEDDGNRSSLRAQ